MLVYGYVKRKGHWNIGGDGDKSGWGDGRRAVEIEQRVERRGGEEKGRDGGEEKGGR